MDHILRPRLVCQAIILSLFACVSVASAQKSLVRSSLRRICFKLTLRLDVIYRRVSFKISATSASGEQGFSR